MEALNIMSYDNSEIMYVGEKQARELADANKIVSASIERTESDSKYTLIFTLNDETRCIFATYRKRNEPRLFSISGAEQKLLALGLEALKLKVCYLN